MDNAAERTVNKIKTGSVAKSRSSTTIRKNMRHGEQSKDHASSSDISFHNTSFLAIPLSL
jgi:hypothetical protein